MKRLKAILSEVLQIDENSITDETSPKNVESWDSFRALLLVSEIEKEFNITFNIGEVMAISCFKEIKEALKKHGVMLKE